MATSILSLFTLTKAPLGNLNAHARIVNEDRVTIIYPIPGLEGGAYFGIYDGHGGSWCANYLRDNLHKFIFADASFPLHIKKAITNGFEKAEREIIRKVVNGEETERTGSCAAVVLISRKKLYVANLGDSRVIISGFSILIIQ